MKKSSQLGRTRVFLLVLAVVFLAAVLIVALVMRRETSSTPASQDLTTLKKFSSEQEFKDYLARSSALMMGGRGGSPETLSEAADIGAQKDAAPATEAVAPERYSETNIQVAGIDEPDIVKTDGQEIFFSANRRPEVFPTDASMRIGMIPPPQQEATVNNIRAFPVDDLKLDAEIRRGGQLLLKDDVLIILPEKYSYGASANGRRIVGYDVSDPASPRELWSAELKGKIQVETARLYGDKIYLVTASTVDRNRPCPFEIFSEAGQTRSIECRDIYHPVANVPVDVTYSVAVLNAASGETEKTISFVGSSLDSVVYMSPDYLYATYYYPGDFISLAISFFKENYDLAGDQTIANLEKLQSYDISENAKMTEYYEIINRRFVSMDADEEARVRNELGNRMDDFLEKKKRELDQTGIVKIDIKSLDLEAGGEVSGKTLNQFSLDEYQGNLRVATTVGNSRWWFGFGGNRAQETANDVYVLGQNLNALGVITDLGLDEKIYSARFIEDKGYLVTFRQIDPFYILDLGNPRSPKKAGELKIPGYSSYLHPIAKNMILGVGEENSRVKVSLFDVADADNPKEIAKYSLEDYYSEIAQTHHAFLHDSKHEIFFLPGSSGGYVFSYAGDNLELEKVVSEISARRAVYIDDYLYVLSDNQVVVLDEKSWERVKELTL